MGRLLYLRWFSLAMIACLALGQVGCAAAALSTVGESADRATGYPGDTRIEIESAWGAPKNCCRQNGRVHWEYSRRILVKNRDPRWLSVLGVASLGVSEVVLVPQLLGRMAIGGDRYELVVEYDDTGRVLRFGYYHEGDWVGGSGCGRCFQRHRRTLPNELRAESDLSALSGAGCITHPSLSCR